LRIAVTGGAGFIGSHLVDRLMEAGHQVIVVDNLFTGLRRNFGRWNGHERFEFIRHDVTEPLKIEVDQIYHLACPASPDHYKYNPIKTLKTSFYGTMNVLGLAEHTGARVLLASASEVYGSSPVRSLARSPPTPLVIKPPKTRADLAPARALNRPCSRTRSTGGT